MSNTHNGIFLSNADGTLKEYATNSGGGSDVDTSTLANKTDISSIILVGSTNTTGETITAGTWFYLNGKPCVAKVDIASGATFTKDTNYEEKTIGSALSELNSNMGGVYTIQLFASQSITVQRSAFYAPMLIIGSSADNYCKLVVWNPDGFIKVSGNSDGIFNTTVGASNAICTIANSTSLTIGITLICNSIVTIS